MISGDTKDALARDLPSDAHCREALLAGLALYGAQDGEFVTHRNAVARLFWSLLDERKQASIETRGTTRVGRLPTFAVALPERLRSTPPKPPADAGGPCASQAPQLADEMLQKVFGGSASEMVMHALSGQKASHQEIEEIRRLLDEFERKLP